nr:hypothetical protein [Mycobacterium avium]
MRALCAYVGGVELWTVDQAAQHWGVTPARARSILSSRHIRRTAGYPVAEIRSVRRRQGARTDLTPPTPATAAANLSTIAQAIAEHPDGDPTRLRLFFEFTRGADEAGTAALSLVNEEPPLTGAPGYDALLAAIAEHITSRYGLPAPLWTATTDRFLYRAWWITTLPSARVQAMLWTPGSFRRRGVFLDRRDLTHDGATPMPEPLFDATEIRRALTALADKLERRNIVGQVHVFGGAAMLLAYNPNRSITRDIDALFEPDGPMVDAIREVAAENGWPSTWMNNQASSYVARNRGEGPRVFDHPYLQVVATPADHLLAMKVLAARAVRDADDIRILVQHLGITTKAEIWVIVDRFFPDVPIKQHARGLVEDILSEQNGSKSV